jgi:hypothetical protein
MSFDIIINNIPARLLFAEADKRIPGKSAELSAEFKPVLLDLFARRNLREAVEFVGNDTVKVLTEKQLKAKRKSYNPKPEVYNMMESVTGDSPPSWWRREGTMLTESLPKLAAFFKQPITIRFRRTGTLDGVSGENEKQVAESIVLNFVGEPEEEEEAAPGPGPRAEAAAPPAVAEKSCEERLQELGITSRKDFTRWAVRNHPDKGGVTKVFQEISSCVDKQYGSGRKTRRKQKNHRSVRKSRKSRASGRA